MEIPQLAPKTFRVMGLKADDMGRVVVSLDSLAHVGGVLARQELTFTTLDPPNLGEEFTVTITAKERP